MGYDGQAWTAGVNAAASQGVVVTSGGANAKGSYATIISALPRAGRGVLVSMQNGPAAADGLVDIAVGGAGAERVIVANLLWSANSRSTAQYYFPLAIARGATIRARWQSTSATQALSVAVHVLHAGFSHEPPCGRVATWGADEAASTGFQVDPGGAANTKGAFVVLAASIPYRAKAVVLAVGNLNNSTNADQTRSIDFAVGPAGFEVVMVPNIPTGVGSSMQRDLPNVIGPIPIDFPRRSRVSVRAQSSSTDVTDRLCRIIVYGIM